jgi:lipoprotein-anchoring transpeptidase ErfK/SrfK
MNYKKSLFIILFAFILAGIIAWIMLKPTSQKNNSETQVVEEEVVEIEPINEVTVESTEKSTTEKEQPTTIEKTKPSTISKKVIKPSPNKAIKKEESAVEQIEPETSEVEPVSEPEKNISVRQESANTIVVLKELKFLSPAKYLFK